MRICVGGGVGNSSLVPLGVNPNLMLLDTAGVRVCVFLCGCKSVGVWVRICVCEGGGWGGNLYPGAPWREPKLDVAGYCMGKSVCISLWV